jgi:hypothetical protein
LTWIERGLEGACGATVFMFIFYRAALAISYNEWRDALRYISIMALLTMIVFHGVFARQRLDCGHSGQVACAGNEGRPIR